jgi:lysine 2,3-aminomutase
MIRNYKEIPIWKDISEEKWNDWKWQFENRITTIEELGKVIDLTPQDLEGIHQSLDKLKMAITPYYATLINQII